MLRYLLKHIFPSEKSKQLSFFMELRRTKPHLIKAWHLRTQYNNCFFGKIVICVVFCKNGTNNLTPKGVLINMNMSHYRLIPQTAGTIVLLSSVKLNLVRGYEDFLNKELFQTLLARNSRAILGSVSLVFGLKCSFFVQVSQQIIHKGE